MDLGRAVPPLMEAGDTPQTDDFIQVLAFGGGHGEILRSGSPLGVAAKARRRRRTRSEAMGVVPWNTHLVRESGKRRSAERVPLSRIS